VGLVGRVGLSAFGLLETALEALVDGLAVEEEPVVFGFYEVERDGHGGSIPLGGTELIGRLPDVTFPR
jgi:hypothetical protein